MVLNWENKNQNSPKSINVYITKGIFIILFLEVFGLVGCNNTHQKSDVKPIEETDTYTTKGDAENSVIESFSSDLANFPLDSLFSSNVLTVGTFHGDEVMDNASQLKWIGLFKGNTGYYLKQTAIKTKHVYDPVLDENEDEKTGWEVQTLIKDSCLLLIEPEPFLADRTIISFKLKTNEIYPGDTLSFTYLGVDYTLFATGDKKKNQFNTDYLEVSNYKLFLTIKSKGEIRKSLLVAQSRFDEAMIDILFVGDIDGDQLLDFIIDTSSHYNAMSPTLYLSKPAKKGEALIPIGNHTKVGC